MDQVKYSVLGVQIDAVSKEQVCEDIGQWVAEGKGGYICCVNVHLAVMASDDTSFARVLGGALVRVADGRPVFWVGRLRRVGSAAHCPGPDLMASVLASSEGRNVGLRHYFFGAKPDVLGALIDQIHLRYPGASVVGWESPPFDDEIVSFGDIATQTERMRISGANVVWVGLGGGKQERWMAANAHLLRPAVLIGVGAAFDFHAGSVARAPKWMSEVGLEWLFRLSSEPSRLWRRYLRTNTLFLLREAKELCLDAVRGRLRGG